MGFPLAARGNPFAGGRRAGTASSEDRLVTTTEAVRTAAIPANTTAARARRVMRRYIGRRPWELRQKWVPLHAVASGVPGPASAVATWPGAASSNEADPRVRVVMSDNSIRAAPCRRQINAVDLAESYQSLPLCLEVR